ncbi:MAG: aminotransferase class III-fold pyridoxal phosphate-dependent enzyme [Sphingomonadales bacterium]
MSKRYSKSEALQTRAEQTIPLGAQTFSKSKTQLPFGVSPYFATRARGSRLWDVDGNEYIDFINGLCAVTLGYSDPDVTEAVRCQLESGVIFSLPHELEIQVAERIVDMVPCAKKVRFGKNGSDATAGAVRVARAFTGRDRIAVCGYHGWQDWYIGATTRNLGVPEATRALTHSFPYDNLGALETLLASHRNEFAAVMLEPMNIREPGDGYLHGVIEMAHRHGALAIFDETITGFRLAAGGAQEYFGAIPDLATFGKGLANGYPLSAVAGRADVMRLMEEVFFSFTMGGEALSLAAAQAALDKIHREPVIDRLHKMGKLLMEGLKQCIEAHGSGDFAEVSGHPSWSFLSFHDAPGASQIEIKTLFLQEMFARGILTLGTHNMSYAHDETDVKATLAVYDEVFPVLSRAVAEGAVRQYLDCEPLTPLFKIR